MHAPVPAQEVHPPRGLCAGLCRYEAPDGSKKEGWFVSVRRSRPRSTLVWYDVRIRLLVRDRSGSSFLGWVPFIVDCGTDVTIIPRKLLPQHAFRGLDAGMCPVTGLADDTDKPYVGRHYPASVLFRAPGVNGLSILVPDLLPLIMDSWQEGEEGNCGLLGMDVLSRVAWVFGGEHFSFWPLPSKAAGPHENTGAS